MIALALLVGGLNLISPFPICLLAPDAAAQSTAPPAAQLPARLSESKPETNTVSAETSDRPEDSLAFYQRLQAAGIEVLVNGRVRASGFIATPDGLAITACHAIWPQMPHRSESWEKQKIQVLVHQLGRLDVELVAVDRGHDLALLRLPPPELAGSVLTQITAGFEKTNAALSHTASAKSSLSSNQPSEIQTQAGYPFLPIASHAALPTETVYLFGAPMFRHQILFSGRMARARPTYEYLANTDAYARVLHISGSAPIGTSGGPWVNVDGEVVAIQSGSLVHYASNQVGEDPRSLQPSLLPIPLELSFASPPQPAARLVISQQSTQTPTLNAAFEEIWEQPTSAIARWPENATGLIPVFTQPGGSANQGNLSKQTLVIAANGHSVATRHELLEIIRSLRPGTFLPVTVTRQNGRSQTLNLRLNMLEADFVPTSP